MISAEDTLGEVEDELFRFARILEGNDELLDKLSNPHIEPARRQQIVTDLLDGKAQPATVNLVGLVVGNGRVRELPAIVDALVEPPAPPRRRMAVAEVRSAIALSRRADQPPGRGPRPGDRQERRGQGRRRPTVQGGLVAQVGDTVIDGSVRRRLEQLRNAF